MQSNLNIARGRRGYEQWSDELINVCGRFFNTKPRDDVDDFYGSLSLSRMADMEFAEVATNASSISKTLKGAKASERNYFFLIYQQAGSAIISQNGKSTLLNAGDSVLVDSRIASEFRYLEEIRHLSFHLPCDVLEKRLTSSKAKVCEAFTMAEPVGNVLNNFIRQIVTKHSLFDAGAGAAMEEALLTILAPLAEDPETDGGNLRDYAKVVNIIEANLSEDITPEMLAKIAGVSVRSLYRLFEDRELSLNTYIREQRLERCVEQFQARDLSHESITQIAYRWGFKDSAHFSRSFRSRYGMSPREYRKELLLKIN